jgi:hypothetical protein
MIRKIYKDEKGSAVIESSMAIVLIMAVFLAGIYFLTAYRDKIVMEMAAKEGSRQYQIKHDTSYAIKELEIGGVKNATVSASESGVSITKNIKITMPIVGNHLFALKANADFHTENKIFYFEKDSSSVGYTGNPYKR